MDTPWYATREDLRVALSSASTARNDAQLDRALDAGSRSVEDLCNRTFWPVVASRSWDWPNRQYARAWRLWLDDSDLISLTSLTAGGDTIPVDDVILQPNRTGPPYRRLEIRLSSSSAFAAGDTPQEAITAVGLWGFCDTAHPAGALSSGIDASTGTVPVTAASLVGVGDLIRVGDERMIVTGKQIGDTGQTLGADLPAKKDSVLLSVQDGTRFAAGDAITVGPETMLVRAVAGAQLTVVRAYDSTVLAAHTAGDAVWASVALTVMRAAAGTTAATAVAGAAISRWVAPAQARTLTIAEAMCTLLSEQSGYARTVRSQAGTGGTRSVAAVTAERDALRLQVADSRLARKVRTRAV